MPNRRNDEVSASDETEYEDGTISGFAVENGQQPHEFVPANKFAQQQSIERPYIPPFSPQPEHIQQNFNPNFNPGFNQIVGPTLNPNVFNPNVQPSFHQNFNPIVGQNFNPISNVFNPSVQPNSNPNFFPNPSANPNLFVNANEKPNQNVNPNSFAGNKVGYFPVEHGDGYGPWNMMISHDDGGGSAKEMALKKVYDIALTAIAYLSFGLFVLQVIMCITMVSQVDFGYYLTCVSR